MPNKTVITSFTKEGYERYGSRFIDSFVANWQANQPRLVVYFEGNPAKDLGVIPDYDPQLGIDWRNIDEVAGLWEFMTAIKPFSLMSGNVNGKYNINYDARMGRKSFILSHALKTFGGKVFWIDADTITHSKVPEDFLDTVLPDDKMCCFLGRDNWYYTESGFLGYNAEHPQAQRFADAVVNQFKTGAIFSQPGWHDCYAFDMVRKQATYEWFHNLAENLPLNTMHPFVNSVLGAYMDHRKGNRKESRSTREDLVKARFEPYWNT